MADDKLEGLAPDEWFGDDSTDNYWTCGTGQVCISERRQGGERQHVQVKVKVEPGSLYGTVGDISLGGALVYAATPLPPGSYVELTLQTENGVATAGGVVRWKLKRTAIGQPGGQVGMGIEFVWMSLQMRPLLGLNGSEAPL